MSFNAPLWSTGVHFIHYGACGVLSLRGAQYIACLPSSFLELWVLPTESGLNVKHRKYSFNRQAALGHQLEGYCTAPHPSVP